MGVNSIRADNLSPLVPRILNKKGNEESSLNLSIFMQKFLPWGWKGYVFSDHVSACVTPITVWVVSNNESNCLLENRMVSTLVWRWIRLL